jgi:ferritin-like metal-binding protein YciE
MMTRDKKLRSRLLDHVRDAHAMETNVQVMLTSMIASTSDQRIKRRLERHLEETREHAQRLERRLAELDAGSSARKEAVAVLGALPKGLIDQVRGEAPAKNARDGFVTEALEIAAYELLERLAQRAGDTRTVFVARQNRLDEERMRRYFARSWDRVVDLSLEADRIAS